MRGESFLHIKTPLSFESSIIIKQITLWKSAIYKKKPPLNLSVGTCEVLTLCKLCIFLKKLKT